MMMADGLIVAMEWYKRRQRAGVEGSFIQFFNGDKQWLQSGWDIHSKL